MTPRFFLFVLLMLGMCAAPQAALAADSWAGRKLSAVLNELRNAGLPLLYSTQIVSDDMVIASDPTAILQLERLRMALDQLGLALQELDAGQGYAVVRSGQPPGSATRLSADGRDPSSEILDEISVYASRYNLTRSNAGTSSTHLPHASLETTAGIEQDALRSVQYLPGASGNGLSALTHVRGGYEDENLVRFDGVELYKPVHFKNFQGLFGLLDPDWIQALNFYSGAYPVQFGDHNAAVLDVAPRVSEASEYTFGSSLLYTRVLGMGSYDDANGHWLFGLRRSNLQEVIRHGEQDIGEPEFDDLLLRHSYAYDGGELRMGTLLLNDDLELQTDERDELATSHDHDIYVWLGLRHDWSEVLKQDTQLTYSQLASKRSAFLQRDNINTGTLLDRRGAQIYTLENQLTLHSSEHTSWLWGVRLKHSKATFDYTSNVDYFAPLATTFAQPANVQNQFVSQYREPDYASWLSLTHDRGAWRTELGLRYDRFPYLPHGTQFSPRLNVQYRFNADTALHLSAGHYTQAQSLHLLDTTLSEPEFRMPERMQQYILGWTRTLLPSLQLRIEAYHKYGSRIAPRSENLLSFITLTNELEIDRYRFAPTHSRAQGIELSLTAPIQRDFGWWFNYSWSRVQDEINGRYVRRSWDQPHAITAGANWNKRRWLLSGSATWHSGWAYTPVFVSSDGSTATLGGRNTQRFGDFASVELRTQYTLPLRSAELQLFVELRNALGRSNECCREVSVTEVNGDSVISIDNDTSMPFIPIVGFNLKF